MSHLNIAIIKKQSLDSSNEKQQFDYLVQKNGEEEYKFFDFEDTAIGGRFDYSSFKNKVEKYLGLSQNEQIDSSEVELNNNIRPFKYSKRDPYATSYSYELFEYQIKQVERSIATAEGIWGNIFWVKEADLPKYKQKWKPDQLFIFEREVPFSNPKFTNEFRASLRNIVKAKETGKLVIFAGAGVSMDSNVPGWEYLINELKNDLDVDENDFLKLGDLYYNARGNKEYQERVQEILKFGKTKFNAIHQKILEIRPVHLITTNYDIHFEQVIEEQGYRYSIIKKDPDLPYSSGNSLFIKMHGDFAEKNIVLRGKDYEDYNKNFPLIESYVKAIFASKLVLFIGFSFDDPNLTMILKTVNDILGKDIQRPYILTTDNKQEKKEKLEGKGLKVLEFEETSVDNYYSQIKNEDDVNSVKNLSLIGQKVFKFLKIVENFDIISDTLENTSIENQITLSLLRFKELGAIPIKGLESISPFRLNKHSESGTSTNAEYDSYNPFHLETLNEDLLSFLEKKKNIAGKIEFLNYEDKQKPHAERELNESFQLIYSSGIHCIIRKNDTSPKHNKLIPKYQGIECNCFRCLHDRLNFLRLIDDLNSASNKLISKQTYQNIDLRQAYGFFKTGQFVKAFYSLEEVKSLSLKNKEYITFFIASNNQILLNPFFWFAHNKISKEEELDQIKEKIKKINLDKLLYELPVDEDIKEVLKIIKDNKVLYNTKNIIEENFQKIVDNYLKYNKGGFRSYGPNYWYIVQSSFYNLWNFYHQNMLFYDEYKSFLELAQLYIESILASYATSEEYRQKISKIHPFFSIVFINYGKPEEMKDLLDKYNISFLAFDDPEKTEKKLIKEFFSLLESGYNETNLFWLEIEKNEAYNLTIKNSDYFENKTQNLFGNILIIFNKIQLEQSQVNEIIIKAIHYLSVSEIFDSHKSLTYFSDFVVHYINSIDNKNVQEIIKYILSDNIWSYDLIKPICNALINTKDEKQILDEEVYVKIIRRAEGRNKWNVGIHEMMPFYILLKEEQRQKFFKNISDYLLADGSRENAIKDAYHWKIWNPKDDNEIFKFFLDKLLKESNNFPDYEINEDGFPVGIHDFTTWNDLHFMVQVIYEYKMFKEDFVESLFQNVNSKMFKWVLKPSEFDYEQFELNWLLVFSEDKFIEDLKTISTFKNAIKKQLKQNYNEEISKIFFEKLS